MNTSSTTPVPQTPADPALDALSPLDGRYAGRVAPLRALLSEAGFVRHRVRVEIEWLIALSDLGMPDLTPFRPAARERLQAIATGFRPTPARRRTGIEAVTSACVKSVEDTR